jgi:hypothetical protein
MEDGMRRGDSLLNQKMFEPDHIRTVLTDLQAAFLRYYAKLNSQPGQAVAQFKAHLREFTTDQARYQEFLDEAALDEYADAPAAFKTVMGRNCPIVKRCLHSQAKVMEQYQKAFYSMSSTEMLEKTTNIVRFANEYVRRRREERPLQVTQPADLGLAELDTDAYTAFGVIGGGIRSHFLYNLYPRTFPNRSQSAIWALYFMTERKDYGFHDGTEFLMIQEDGAQQNYFYPYELFTYYAHCFYRLIEQALAVEQLRPHKDYRFVYVDCFLTFVTEQHEHDINTIRPPSLRFD